MPFSALPGTAWPFLALPGTGWYPMAWDGTAWHKLALFGSGQQSVSLTGGLFLPCNLQRNNSAYPRHPNLASSLSLFILPTPLCTHPYLLVFAASPPPPSPNPPYPPPPFPLPPPPPRECNPSLLNNPYMHSVLSIICFHASACANGVNLLFLLSQLPYAPCMR